MPRLSANSCVAGLARRQGVGGTHDLSTCDVGPCDKETYLRDCVLHDLLVRHVALVADEQLVDAVSGIAVDLLQPLLDVVERVHVGDIVHHADAVGTTVVGRGDGSETLLSRGIPLE